MTNKFQYPQCPQCGEELHPVYDNNRGVRQISWAHDAPIGCKPTDFSPEAFKKVNGVWKQQLFPGSR